MNKNINWNKYMNDYFSFRHEKLDEWVYLEHYLKCAVFNLSSGAVDFIPSCWFFKQFLLYYMMKNLVQGRYGRARYS